MLVVTPERAPFRCALWVIEWSECELGAELDQTPAHDLDRVPPLVRRAGAIRGLLVLSGARVENVVDVEIALKPPARAERGDES